MRADFHQSSLVQDADAMADQFDLRQQMRTEKDGFAGAIGFQQQLAHRDPRQRIERRSWLVEDQQLGIVDQRLRQTDALLHSAGELGHIAAGFQFELNLRAAPRGIAAQAAVRACD